MIFPPLLFLRSQEPTSRELVSQTLVVGETAIYQMDAIPVAVDAVDLRWSPDGKTLLVRARHEKSRETVTAMAQGASLPANPPVQEFLVFNLVNGKTSSVFRLPEEAKVLETQWFSGSPKFLVTISTITEEGTRSAVVVAGGSAQPRTLLADQSFQSIDVDVSPYRTVAVLRGATYRRSGGTFVKDESSYVIDAEGRILTQIAALQVAYVSFPPDGRVMIGVKPTPGKGGTAWASVNVSTGNLKADPAFAPKDLDFEVSSVRPRRVPWGFLAEDFDFSALQYRVEAVDAQMVVPNWGNQRVEVPSVVLWGKDEPSTNVLVSSDAIKGTLSPTLSAVAYIHKGTAMVRPLVIGPKDVFDLRLTAALRKEAIEKAKNTATGLMVYAADNDDDLPPPGSDWQKLLSPYVKDPTILSNFVLAQSGRNLKDLEAPAATVLGYTAGPGGYAVAFADGHVVWLTELPKINP